MDSRSIILNKVKSALKDVDRSSLQKPIAPHVWSINNLSPQEKAEAFKSNLESVAGQTFICNSIVQVADHIVKKFELDSRPTISIGCFDTPDCQLIAEELRKRDSRFQIIFQPEDRKVSPKDYETIIASVISPLLLLSDTGSCVVEGQTAFERFMCYLSPKCLVVARYSQLREHLVDAWNEIESKMGNTNQHGEIALITGPSRTADIEKKLVLGVHGPQELIVYLINDL